jgi:hypothetical protein
VPIALQAIRPMVAGIDVGSREHWVCGPARADGEPNVRVFSTTTSQLEELVTSFFAMRSSLPGASLFVPSVLWTSIP